MSDTANALAHALMALSFFSGSWHCSGTFAATAKTITSTEVFGADVGGTAMLKHHADEAPWNYDAVELWSYDAQQKAYRAVIEDDFGGVRTFYSPGWAGTSLTWTDTDAMRTQRFVYERLGASAYRVSYRVSRSGPDRLVDTLICKKQ